MAKIMSKKTWIKFSRKEIELLIAEELGVSASTFSLLDIHLDIDKNVVFGVTHHAPIED